MCDTIIVTPEATTDGVMIFGKNSDREPNEAHQLLSVPAMEHPSGSVLRMTYIQIPQVKHTYALLLAKPFWIWGAEMGVNEHGVAIGNEAVFTKVNLDKEGGLIGMDLLRLGLERGRTAYQALELMVGLLETYGQGGNCGFQRPFYYHNSFLIADPGEAWVFETAGKHWAARQVKGVYSISNGLTIQNSWDLASTELVEYAIRRNWCKNKQDFSFRDCYSDPLYTTLSNCRGRCERTRNLLEEKEPAVNIKDVMNVLRDHGETVDNGWRPDRGVTGSNVCMHAGFGPVRSSQTVGSMVSHLHSDCATHFFTGTAAPCTSIFKPVWLDSGFPEMGSAPDGNFNPETLFWRHEQIHRQTILDYPNRIRLHREERNELEDWLIHQAFSAVKTSPLDRLELTEKSFQAVIEAEAAWLERLKNAPLVKRNGYLYHTAWMGFNRASAYEEP
jgi:dipeptidase